jgi:hypothetical protein
MNEPELGAGIDPGMDFNPFPSSILDKTRQDLNPQPLDHESSPLTTRPDLRPLGLNFLGARKKAALIFVGEIDFCNWLHKKDFF